MSLTTTMLSLMVVFAHYFCIYVLVVVFFKSLATAYLKMKGLTKKTERKSKDVVELEFKNKINKLEEKDAYLKHVLENG